MFHPKYSLFDDEPGEGGGVGLLEETGAAKEETPAKSAAEIELETTKAELVAARKSEADAKADAKYWAERGKAPAPAAVVDEPELDEEPEIVVEKLTPEEIIDGLTKDPRGTMKKLGLVTQEEMRASLKAAREETRQVVAETRSDAEFGLQIEKEFPEFRKTDDPLTIRAGQIYRDAVALDPKLAGTKSLAMMAGRQARAELKAAAGGKEPTAIEDETTELTPRQRQEARREKIERQVPSKERSNALDDDEPELSGAALAMAKALGNDPKEVAKQARSLRNNGR